MDNPTAGPGKTAQQTFKYFLDGEEHEAPNEQATPREILQKAGLSPDDHYLTTMDGPKVTSWQGKLDESLRVTGVRFQVARRGPTPVS